MSFVYPAMVFCLIIIAVLIVVALMEAARHQVCVRAIPLRILVNGTRGKTTVTRLLQCGLKEGGYTVLAKTTGSEAVHILPDGTIKPVDRRRGVNVLRETIDFFKLASNLKVDAVVLECQAVRPESQTLVRRLVQPTVSIITNARIDHVDVMGFSVESTAEVLRMSVPEGQSFYTSDLFFLADPSAIVVSESERNKSLALKVLTDLGVYESAARRGMESFLPDIGLVGPFTVDGRTVINAFAANDMQSAAEVLGAVEDLGSATVVYNNRSDREFRLLYFAKVFASCGVRSIVVVGDHVEKSARYLSTHVSGAVVVPFKGTDEELLGLCGRTVICMGNIKGRGEAFIRYCKGDD